MFHPTGRVDPAGGVRTHPDHNDVEAGVGIAGHGGIEHRPIVIAVGGSSSLQRMAAKTPRVNGAAFFRAAASLPSRHQTPYMPGLPPVSCAARAKAHAGSRLKGRIETPIVCQLECKREVRDLPRFSMNIPDLLERLHVEPMNSGACHGDWIEAPSGGELASLNPATANRHRARATWPAPADYEQVMARAADAFLEWRMIPAPQTRRDRARNRQRAARAQGRPGRAGLARNGQDPAPRAWAKCRR